MSAAEEMKQYQQDYEGIMRLYDYADELALTVNAEFVKNPHAQLGIVEPMIEQLEESADILCEEYLNFAEGKAKPASRGKIEKALRKLFTALNQYSAKLTQKAGRGVKTISNIADGIIQHIKAEAEQIIVAFLNFTQISLDRIMHHKQLEEMKRTQQHVFLQLHQSAQQAH